MQITSAIVGLVTFTSLFAATSGYKSLPWDGRAFNLTVDTLTNKYLTPIFIQRNGGNDGNPADYVSLQYQARPEGYNDDDGALVIGVDGNAIFNDNTDMRRSDLFQQIEGTADGTSFFRASVTKAEAFLNPYEWQLIWLAGLFEIGVDAAANPPMMFYRTNGTSESKWSTEFVPGTWYNFGFGLEKSADGNNMVVEFYTSTGQDELVFNVASELPGSLLTLNDFHIGLLTQTTDGSAPAMNAKQDVVSFNGISAEATAIDAGAPTPAPSEGGSAVVEGSSSSSIAGEARSSQTFTFNDRK
ncbi:hypothetical protein PHYBOEH_005335 [Phytophthora boehmeriae]|uniref:Glycoside hydrolase 131 catalytic N-terminal domain-containing protein n=1 Tax=Phytophthora boehmeriae TaxID=109152 RepID=A0A8T1X3L6_9STRA|nr:hypothetical protein PHYBOEH_005335 [Phytophthora boehmeriae]